MTTKFKLGLAGAALRLVNVFVAMDDTCRDTLLGFQAKSNDCNKQSSSARNNFIPHPMYHDTALLVVPRDGIVVRALQQNAALSSTTADNSTSRHVARFTSSCKLLPFLVYGLREYTVQNSPLVDPIVSLLRIIVYRSGSAPLTL